MIFQRSGKVYCQLVYRIFAKSNILTQKQWQALNALEAHADRNSVALDVEEGDIQLINNLAILHGREAWVDTESKSRHYYRLGLRDPEKAWPRPEGYEWLFDDHFKTAPEDQVVPVTDFDPYGLTSLSEQNHG